MSSLLRSILAISVGLALLVPATGGAQEPPPDDLAPPPPPSTPADPEVPPEVEGPTTVTIKVPPLREAKPAPKKAAPQQAAPQQAAPAPDPVRRTSPRRSVRVYEPVTPSYESEAPVVEQTPAKAPRPKAKRVKKNVQRPRPRAVAKPTAPVLRTIRDPDRAGAVLAAQFTLGGNSDGAGVNTTVLVLAIMIAALLGCVVGVVGAAPLLADRWPKVFVPVIDATDRIVLAGVCLAGAAATLAITWALTGPGS